jgi:hypothetical protein
MDTSLSPEEDHPPFTGIPRYARDFRRQLLLQAYIFEDSSDSTVIEAGSSVD